MQPLTEFEQKISKKAQEYITASNGARMDRDPIAQAHADYHLFDECTTTDEAAALAHTIAQHYRSIIAAHESMARRGENM